MDERTKFEILVESQDIAVIRELIFRDYGFEVTDAYIKDLIVFVQDMLDGRDDRDTEQ
jgi:hypothetical protein